MLQAILKSFFRLDLLWGVVIEAKALSPMKTIPINKHPSFAKQLVPFAVKFLDPEG